jgi:polyhydroxyalkanoate synthesis regulator phasin
MADRASASDRNPLETFALAGLGALALAAERADTIADDLAQRLDVDRDEVRAALADALASWRREARRMGESAGDAAARIGGDFGIASSETVAELELRVAQLEHRLKLLERGS